MLWVDYIRICNAYAKEKKESWIKFSYVAYMQTDGKTSFNKFISWLDEDKEDASRSLKSMLDDPETIKLIKEDLKVINKVQ